MVKARLQKERGKGQCPREINRINLRNDLDREDMNIEINKNLKGNQSYNLKSKRLEPGWSPSWFRQMEDF